MNAVAHAAASEVIDLRSDFLARRTPAMEEAWARAQREPYRFGLREDPHQVALERRIAQMTGHEDALVFPTCTMANLVGTMLGSSPGTRVITHQDAHMITSEAGGAAAIAGVQLVPIPGDPWTQQSQRWADAVDGGDVQKPACSLFVVENTHNRAGGLPLERDYLEAICAIARERGIRTHLDGARLFNAAAALDTPLDTLARGFDTVALSLNKGFGAPIAAVLAGSRSDMAKALVLRQRLGGGIRPTGPAAAATLAALDDVAHFAQSHRLARRLAQGLAAIDAIAVDPAQVLSNIVVVTLPGPTTAVEVQARLARHGLLALPFGEHRLRMTTYRGITEAQIDTSVAIARRTLGGA
ncbi:MAG TPA: GntG family PLP-dependent aldolase [Casimicrobiaceae bacterium]|nr:GntG family PLP-dependent aldolase [Casimicrobiaceae bacterium]